MGIENENGLTVKDSTISPNLTEKNIESYIFELRISFRVAAIFKIASDSFTDCLVLQKSIPDSVEYPP